MVIAYQLIISCTPEVLIIKFRPIKMVLGTFYSSSSDIESYLAQKNKQNRHLDRMKSLV